METPDLIEPIRGFRCWNLLPASALDEHKDDGLSLCAAFVGYVWEPGVNKAECQPGRRAFSGEHTAPYKQCMCGLYSVFDFKEVKELGHGKAIGVTENWGECEVHETGIRSEYAKPIALMRPGIKELTIWPHIVELQHFLISLTVMVILLLAIGAFQWTALVAHMVFCILLRMGTGPAWPGDFRDLYSAKDIENLYEVGERYQIPVLPKRQLLEMVGEVPKTLKPQTGSGRGDPAPPDPDILEV